MGFCLEDAHRAASLGVRNVLVADEGVLWALNEQRVAGDLPADMRFKISVLIGPVNPVSFRVIAALGADSINVHSDLTVAQLAEIRAASSAALAMSSRLTTSAASSVSTKRPRSSASPLRSTSSSGFATHPASTLSASTSATSQPRRDKNGYRRARLTLDILERGGGAPLPMSPLGDPSLPVPERFRAG